MYHEAGPKRNARSVLVFAVLFLSSVLVFAPSCFCANRSVLGYLSFFCVGIQLFLKSLEPILSPSLHALIFSLASQCLFSPPLCKSLLFSVSPLTDQCTHLSTALPRSVCFQPPLCKRTSFSQLVLSPISARTYLQPCLAVFVSSPPFATEPPFLS